MAVQLTNLQVTCGIRPRCGRGTLQAVCTKDARPVLPVGETPVAHCLPTFRGLLWIERAMEPVLPVAATAPLRVTAANSNHSLDTCVEQCGVPLSSRIGGDNRYRG